MHACAAHRARGRAPRAPSGSPSTLPAAAQPPPDLPRRGAPPPRVAGLHAVHRLGRPASAWPSSPSCSPHSSSQKMSSTPSGRPSLMRSSGSSFGEADAWDISPPAPRPCSERGRSSESPSALRLRTRNAARRGGDGTDRYSYCRLVQVLRREWHANLRAMQLAVQHEHCFAAQALRVWSWMNLGCAEFAIDASA